MTDKEEPPCHSSRNFLPDIIKQLQVNEHTEHLPRFMEPFSISSSPTATDNFRDSPKPHYATAGTAVYVK